MKFKSTIRPAPRDEQPTDIARRFGHEALYAAATRCRAKWGSPQARALRAELEAAGHTVERQFRLGHSLFAADFFLPRHRIAVLLDGRINGYRRRDALKRRLALCKALGFEAIAAAETDAPETILARLTARIPGTPAALAA